MKKCSICKEIKETSEFPKDTRMKDGFSSNCKFCKKEISKKYREKNNKNADNCALPTVLLADTKPFENINKIVKKIGSNIITEAKPSNILIDRTIPENKDI